MSLSQPNDWDRPCNTVFLQDRINRSQSLWGPSSVIYYDSRPDQIYHYRGQLHALHTDLSKKDPVKSPAHQEVLSDLLEDGLALDWFIDTKIPAVWLGAMNYYTNPASLNLPPLELVVAHGESHANIINEQLTTVLPAGFILSGSPKMLTETRYDPVTISTCQTIKTLSDNRVPCLGICYGMHLLCYALLDILPGWLTVPDDMYVEWHPRLNGAFSSCTPQARRMIYGSRMIKRFFRHPMLNQVHKLLALKAHSQYIPPHQINPSHQATLATSQRLFRHSKHSKQREQVAQDVVEVIELNPYTYGVQPHPELTPQFLIALAHMEGYQQIFGEQQISLPLLFEELDQYPRGYFAGQRLGYNFTKRIMMPAYIDNLGVAQSVKQILQQRLVEKNPSLALQ
jgi:GMP synthase-like glutamine amidotransferase